MMSKLIRALLTVTLLSAFLMIVSAARAQVAPHSGDVAFSAGYANIGKGSNFAASDMNRSTVGGSGGYNLTQYIAVIGELNFFPLPQVLGVNEHMLNYGGAVRFNLIPAGKVVPYGVVGGGGSRFTASESGASASVNGNYFGGGGGLSIYLGRNWGVRGEFRDSRFGGFSIAGITASTNVFAATGGIFCQFGGTSKPAKR